MDDGESKIADGRRGPARLSIRHLLSSILHPHLVSAFICVHLWLILFPSFAHAAWFDAAWPYRRPIDVTWDAEHSSGEELATAEFYSDGHALHTVQDVRVATDDGKLVASHILQNGPGDRIRVAFSLQKGLRKYAVYFGNPHPDPPPAALDDVKWHAGLMLELRAWKGGGANSFDSIERAWNRSGQSLGQAMIPRPFIGHNPFGPQQAWISKMVGSVFVPMTGQYTFAITVDDEAALYIDGKPVLVAHIGPPDTRYRATVSLDRGRHDFLLYHVNYAGDGRVTVGWQRPDAGGFDVIPREAFGICFGSVVGPMEENGRTFLADFTTTQIGECFFADHYSFRYHFVANAKSVSAARYEWDFGDGQTATAAEVDHVYLNDGAYPVRLTVKVDTNSDTQTNRFVADRLWDRITSPPEDKIVEQSKVLATYDLRPMSAEDLRLAALLHLRAERRDPALAAANRLAEQKSTPDPVAAYEALLQIDRDLLDHDRLSVVTSMWDRVPRDANIQPRAAIRAAQLALWWTGDFEKAVKLLEPFSGKHDDAVQRLYGQALILAGRADAGRKVLLDLAPQGPLDRRAALSGASARSVEFFITERDAEAGEDAWDRWQAKYPADFLEGYSAMLRAKLIALRKQFAVAAKVTEAFAVNVPQSSYAPQLLNYASKLLATDDPQKSKDLHELLKQKYPEDPLSQQ